MQNEHKEIKLRQFLKTNRPFYRNTIFQMVATQRQDTTRKEQFIDPTDNDSYEGLNV